MSGLSSAAVRRLAAALRGSVLSRSDASFDVARRELLWNRLPIERRPELIVRAAEAQDVVQALACAREHGLRVAVRCGGHSFCRAPVREGVLVLDVGGLRRSTIDAATRTAVVQPGMTGGALARALAAHGLAFPAGHCA